MENEILDRLRALEEKLDNVARTLEEIRATFTARTSQKKKKEKLPPPTELEISADRQRFSRLYQSWLGGQELEVQNELDTLEVEQLRRFADANNLNVTSKMSKQRVMELISARFREKRQLHRSSNGRSEPSV